MAGGAMAFPAFASMNETAIITAIQKLIESGALKNLDQPGVQSFLIYALLILLAVLSFRVVVINGWFKKGVERFFSLEEAKVKHLADLNEKIIGIQKQIEDEHDKLSDVLNMLHAQRKTDK